MKFLLKQLGIFLMCFTMFNCSTEQVDTIETTTVLEHIDGLTDEEDILAKTPETLLKLSKWKITIPIDGNDSDDEADEVYYGSAKKNSSSGYGFLENLHKKDYDFYYKSGSNWVNFRADAGDPTTGNSDNPRSELREMEAGGVNEIGWDAESSKKRVLNCKFQIVKLPSSGKVCFMQIHGDEDYDGWDDAIRLQVRGSANASSGKVTMYVMGDVVNEKADDLFTVDIGSTIQMTLVAQNGKITVHNGSSNSSAIRTYDCDSGKNYFKAGIYLQSKPTSGYGEVRFKSIQVTD